MTEYYQDSGALALTNAEAGLEVAANIAGNYVSSVDVGLLGGPGVITVVYSSADPQNANAAIDTATLTLTPNTNNPGSVDWDCAAGAILVPKWLPAACRP